MKYILFTDLHFGAHNNNFIWLNSSIFLAKNIINCCKENNINEVIFLGDFFNERKSINSKTIWYALDFIKLFEDNKINLYLIIGNHDTYFKNEIKPHSLKIFENFNFIHIIEDNYELNKDITLIPWNNKINNVITPYIMGHFSISGFEDNLEESDEHFKIKDFKNFKKVFSGHFHNPKQIGNIKYLGSCMQFTFHDLNSLRGYYIFDSENGNEEFIEFKECPQYKIILSNQEFTEKDINNNVIKLVYVEELSSIVNEKLIEKITSLKPALFYTEFSNLNKSDELITQEDSHIEIKNNMTLLFEFIDKFENPNHINANIVKNMIKNLLKEDI